MKDFYTVSELATLFRVTERRVQQMILEGLFPNAKKVNPSGKTSAYIVPSADVDAELRRRETAGEA